MPECPYVFSETTVEVFVGCGCSLNFVKQIEIWLISVQYKHQNIHLNLTLKFIGFAKKNARYLVLNWIKLNAIEG
jgi:hypothetical protein